MKQLCKSVSTRVERETRQPPAQSLLPSPHRQVLAQMEHINIDMNRLKSGEVNLGVGNQSILHPKDPLTCVQTSIMAVQFDNGVVIGADSRTTTGSYIVRLRLARDTFGSSNHGGPG